MERPPAVVKLESFPPVGTAVQFPAAMGWTWASYAFCFVISGLTAAGVYNKWEMFADYAFLFWVFGVLLLLLQIVPTPPKARYLAVPVFLAWSFFCGALVTSAQILAGASGAVLDVFYLQSGLNRFQIIRHADAKGL